MGEFRWPPGRNLKIIDADCAVLFHLLCKLYDRTAVAITLKPTSACCLYDPDRYDGSDAVPIAGPFAKQRQNHTRFTLPDLFNTFVEKFVQTQPQALRSNRRRPT